ncbi:MAG: DUF4147 domain-containing protein [Gammaproteobacteria bacterium]|nr:DUF4147 domain-containing protein [Gammaproteobacteria bacterium]
MHSDKSRRDLLAIYLAAVDAVNGRRCVSQHLRSRDHFAGDPVYVIALGKAATTMVSGAADELGERIVDAFIVTKTGYAEPLPWPVHEGGHPVPDQSSLESGKALESFVRKIPVAAAVLVLLSGGASAVVESLADDVGPGQLVRLNQWLLASGLTISQCNSLRKRLSRIKAGGLAQWLQPRRVVTLVISDVAGDDPAVIGSGPMTGSAVDSFNVDLADKLPEDIRRLLTRSIPVNAEPPSSPYYVVANLEQACQAAVAKAEQLGYRAVYHEKELLDDVDIVARDIVGGLESLLPNSVFVSGGEPTVELPANPGRGGRCQHVALSVAHHIKPGSGIMFLAGATDGSDGPGTDAGALVDENTIRKMEQEGVNADRVLLMADSGSALGKAGDLISTGPTGTNVRDLFIGIRR